MLTIDDILDRVGDGLSSWVVGDVFGRGIDDEIWLMHRFYTQRCVSAPFATDGRGRWPTAVVEYIHRMLVSIRRRYLG